MKKELRLHTSIGGVYIGRVALYVDGDLTQLYETPFDAAMGISVFAHNKNGYGGNAACNPDDAVPVKLVQAFLPQWEEHLRKLEGFMDLDGMCEREVGEYQLKVGVKLP